LASGADGAGIVVVVVARGVVVVAREVVPTVASLGRVVVAVTVEEGALLTGVVEFEDCVFEATVLAGAIVEVGDGATEVVEVDAIDDVVVVAADVVGATVDVVGASVVVVVVVVVVVAGGDVAGTDVAVMVPVHGNGVPQLNAVELTLVTVRPIELKSVNRPDASVASRRSFVLATGTIGPFGIKAEV
jgi:hypothetical protein